METTELSSGQIALITWKDDKRQPRIEAMGRMWIKLHDTKEGYVAILAKHVDPNAHSQSVLIPAGLPGSSHYFLSYSFKRPNLTIYSADFTITPHSYLFPGVADLKLANETTTHRTGFLSSLISATNKPPIKSSTPTASGTGIIVTTTPHVDRAETGVNSLHGKSGNNFRKVAGTRINWGSYKDWLTIFFPAVLIISITM